MLSLKKVLTINNFIVFIGALVFTLALFAPTRFRTVCPQGRISDPVPGGSCPLFIDANQDQLCDYLYPTAIPHTSTFEFKFLTEAVIFSLLLFASIIALFSKEVKIQILRFPFLFISLVYFGVLLAKKVCPIATLQALFILKEAVVLKFPIFLIFLLPIITAVIFGRVFCGWLCPIGAFQEFIYRVFKKIGIKSPKIGKKWRGFLETLPFLVLTVVIAAGLTAQQMLFCRLEPFGYLFGRTRDFIPLLLLIGLLFSLPFLFRPFCKFICPYGAVLALLSHYSIFRLKINRKKCTKCGLCERICPMEAIKKQKINFSNCILCGDCQKQCPKNGISF